MVDNTLHELFKTLKRNSVLESPVLCEEGKIKNYRIGAEMLHELEKQGKCEVIDIDDPIIPYMDHQILVDFKTETIELHGKYVEVIAQIMMLFDDVSISSDIGNRQEMMFSSVLYYKEEK